jgi:hypothetical protein
MAQKSEKSYDIVAGPSKFEMGISLLLLFKSYKHTATFHVNAETESIQLVEVAISLMKQLDDTLDNWQFEGFNHNLNAEFPAVKGTYSTQTRKGSIIFFHPTPPILLKE